MIVIDAGNIDDPFAGVDEIKLYYKEIDLVFSLGSGLPSTPTRSRKLMVPALLWFAQNSAFTDFYAQYDVRVRVYGDARRFFCDTPYEEALDAFDTLTRHTADHGRHRLFFGVFPHDTVEATAELAVRYHSEHGDVPDRRTLVEMYYGEYVAPVDLFISFGKLRTFDIPLLMTGTEDLYFTVSPSLYLTEQQLRDILYDHLYARIKTKVDLQPDDWASMRDFYRANVGRTLGVGRQNGSVWRPLPQVK